MSKLYLCGITNYREHNNIKDLFNSTKDYIDGFVWTIDNVVDIENREEKTKYNDFGDFLKDIKRQKPDSEFIYHKYNHAHDWLANEWLHSGQIKNEDYVLILDSKEKPTDFFIQNIRNIIKDFEKNNFGALYCSGRPYLIKFFDDMYFWQNPHWALYNLHGNIYNIQEEEKDKYIINKRKLNPELHFCIHNLKYLYEHGRSNQMNLAYGKYGQEIVNYHENKRFWFRHYCRKVLGLEFTLGSLEEYFRVGNYTSEFIEYCELEFPMSEFFQIKILRHNFMGNRPEDPVGMHPRYQWSFKNYLKFGDGWIDKDYKGTILKYESLTY